MLQNNFIHVLTIDSQIVPKTSRIVEFHHASLTICITT